MSNNTHSPDASTSSDAQRVESRYRVLLWLVALGFFMQALDATIVNTALPSIARSLQIDPLQMHDAVVVYVLTVAVLIPVSGWMADRFGLRRVYVLAIGVFTLASLGCALAQTYGQLLLGRVLQGVGGAFLLPVGRLALLRILPRPQFLAAMGFIAIPGLIGPLIGPTLGGLLVQYASWHWIFLINVPIGMIGMVLTLRHMPDTIVHTLPRFDYIGLVWLMLTMVGITLGLEQVGQQRGLGLVALGLLGIGGIGLVLYVRHARQDSRALFRADLFDVTPFRIGIMGNVLTRLGSGAMPFIVPLTLQLGMGYEPAQAGMLMIPMMLGAILVKQLATAGIRRLGYFRMLSANTLLVGFGIMSFAILPWHQQQWTLWLHLFLFGCANSMQFTAMNTLTLKNLTPTQSANGNSLLSMVINICMSLSVALVGVLLTLLHRGEQTHGALWAFQWCYVVLGGMTVMATGIFWQLRSLQVTAESPCEKAS